MTHNYTGIVLVERSHVARCKHFCLYSSGSNIRSHLFFTFDFWFSQHVFGGAWSFQNIVPHQADSITYNHSNKVERSNGIINLFATSSRNQLQFSILPLNRCHVFHQYVSGYLCSGSPKLPCCR